MADETVHLDRRRGSEAVLRDAQDRRWVVPTDALPKDARTFRIRVETETDDRPAAADANALAREFLSRMLTRP